jgi:hypothetical protein
VADSGVPTETVTDTASSGWQVSPASCALTGGSSCTLTVTEPAGGGPGSLTLAAPNGLQTVTLTGRTATTLSLSAPRQLVAGGKGVVSGRLTSEQGRGLSGQTVTLEGSVAGVSSSTPAVFGTATTSADGGFRFGVGPTVDTTYTLVFAGTATLGSSSSRPTAVTVASRLTAALSARRVAPGGSVTLHGMVTPIQAGRRVGLQRHGARGWRTIATTKVGRTGAYAFRVAPGTVTGPHSFRTVLAADADNAVGTSPTRTVHVT